jgi:hypothetical protein
MKQTMIVSLSGLICILIIASVQAQILPIKFNKDSSVHSLSKYISKNYEINSDSMQNTCLKGWSFVKFEVNKSQKVHKIGFTVGTPSPIKEAFKKAILSTDSLWNFADINIDPKSSFIVLLPYFFNFWAGCKDQENVQYLATFPENEKYWENRTLFFDDNTNHSTSECILLSEIQSFTVCVKK